MAWGLSVAVHAAVFFGMLALVFPLTPSAKEPDFTVPHGEVVGPIDLPSIQPLEVSDLTKQLQVPDSQEPRPVPKEFAEISELTTLKKPELSIIGIGAGGGDFDKYRIPMDIGANTEFFGVGSSARGARGVVYVVDRSGSMLDSLDFVKEELKRSISALRRSQKFHVIFFNSGPPLECPPKQLASAIEARKEQLFEFLDRVQPQGGTNPAPALHRALSLEPDLIYLLSDGADFEPCLLGKLDSWNGNRRVRIYTIAYLDQTGSELLERIAREHNGEFKFVTEDDLP